MSNEIEEDLEFPPFCEAGDEASEAEAEDVESITYEDIYGEALLGDVTITIPQSEIQKVETGIKNHKARLLRNANSQGIELEKNKLSFSINEDSKGGEGWVDMTISIVKPASVKVKMFSRKTRKDEEE